ncbi:MAG: M28 family peptidase [Tannerellaceae bacterium]|jgi:Zn-dependent M28 family amino/carboxypeptidase|nr:M28 family peptidase [Tannerellaceae bacterium]
MRTFKWTILTLLLLLCSAPRAQEVTDEALYRDAIKTLASDEFGGRKPLSPHEALTVNYIADKFRELGLSPANGSSYFQEVPLLTVNTVIKNNSVTIDGKKGKATLKPFTDFVLWSQRKDKNLKLNKADYVFVGFGINAPEYGWNDYEGLDMKGKIAVILVNDPGYYDDNLFRGKNMTYYGRWTYKFEEANRQGAAAAFVIHDTGPASYDWSVVQNSWAGKNLGLYSESEVLAFKGWISNASAHLLFDKGGLSYEQSLAAASKKGFKAFTLPVRSTVELTNDARIENSANVAAILPGTDLKDEYIIYTAHWDHFGIGIPIDGDSIYNGASDNASGVAGLFVIAGKFKQLPVKPRRSIVFISVTGEESGLLGSEYYATHPLYPVNKTALNLNMDAYAPRHRTRDITLGAAGDSDIDRYVVEAAATQGRTVKVATNQTGGGYFRSDHFNFAKVGIPVVIASGGRDYLDPQAVDEEKVALGERRTYHQPTDEYHSWWNVSGALDDIYLLYGIGLRLSNDGYFPKWSEGVPYGKVRRESLNK